MGHHPSRLRDVMSQSYLICGCTGGEHLVLHGASLLRHQRVHVQKVRDFPQTKLDNGINSPFLLNEYGNPRFFFQVFAKNSLRKKIFEEEKKFGSRT